MKAVYIFLFVGLIAVRSFAKDGLDELDSILDDLDNEEVTQKPTTNPCDDHVCGWGKECVVDKKNRPVCECIAKCPEFNNDPEDQVCGSNNQTFPSLCELYRQRCLCKKRGNPACDSPAFSKVHLEYLGACKELDTCTDALMAQFPDRMADWLFQVMKEMKKRRELHNLEWEELLSQSETDDEKRHVYPIIWKFCDLDIKPHDKHVSHHELIPITAPVIPMESCIKPFLESCDADKDGSITIKEWGKCLGLKEGEIQERC
ncbi:putative effector protein [Aphelenchoides besseyi]|nr:putative effector protein [Aphelenchoides besseyi]KAI6202587.1 putative effector protein [Aphelenchoides besseyi]